MEAVKAGNEKEEVGELLCAVLVVLHVGTLNDLGSLERRQRLSTAHGRMTFTWALKNNMLVRLEGRDHFFRCEGLFVVGGVAMFHAVDELRKRKHFAFLIGHFPYFGVGKLDTALVSHDKVVPLPCLRTYEDGSANDGGNHPPRRGRFLQMVARIHRQDHGHGRHNQDKRHEGNIQQGLITLQSGEVREHIFRNRPCRFIPESHKAISR